MLFKSVGIKYISQVYFSTEPKFEKYNFPEIQIVNNLTPQLTLIPTIQTISYRTPVVKYWFFSKLLAIAWLDLGSCGAFDHEIK